VVHSEAVRRLQPEQDARGHQGTSSLICPLKRTVARDFSHLITKKDFQFIVTEKWMVLTTFKNSLFNRSKTQNYTFFNYVFPIYIIAKVEKKIHTS
jgi:hypothetical protein